MLVDISKPVDLPDVRLQFSQIHPTPDLPDRVWVRGLNANLQLNQPGAHLGQQRKLLLRQQIC